jgi:glycosyltransferase involved in cell wall biosynthesis
VFGAWILRHPRALIRPFLAADRQARRSTGSESVPTLRTGATRQNTGTLQEAGEHHRSASPLVSVIVPTFRRERGLREAIDSVLAEGIESFEIIVVDDSPERSARSTVEAVRDPRVRYVVNPVPSGGCPAKVRNLGIELAAGKYLYFLDDDDRVVAGGLTAMITALEANPDRGVAFGVVLCVGPDEATRATYERWFGWAARQARRFARSSLLTVGLIMFRGTVIINSCCVIRADCARRLGGFDASIPVYEDVEFFTRGIRAFGHVFVDVPVLSYTTGKPSIIHDLDGDWAPVQQSYAMMHGKYMETHGALDYRLLQVTSKLLPADRAT